MLQIISLEREKEHIINLNCQLQKDVLQTSEVARIAKDLLEKNLHLKIQSLEEKMSEYAEVNEKKNIIDVFYL